MKVAAAVGAQAAHHMNKIAWPKEDNGLDYIPPIRERLGPEVMERVGKAVEGRKLKQAGNG